ncbi:hypothetical protein ACJMK2_020624 [Sinanodonta woodiana]|uniref:Branched-chain-amino-acid aminotransferase n=1 Tax=Sinanodonta woodiana TaxID=1069815 RepID=A0ABD3U1Y8_SINWO
MAIRITGVWSVKAVSILQPRWIQICSTSSRLASTAAPVSFKASDLQIKRAEKSKPKPKVEDLVFGANYSDHMLEIEYTPDKGWGKPVISPFHNLSVHPGIKALHYAVELFEGMKAYHCVDNKIRLFRPMENMKRLLSTAERLCLPTFDGREFLKCIKKLVSIDSEWVPRSLESSLYIRPTFIGTEPTLGVSKSSSSLLYVLIGPVGPYFKTGFKPVSLLADPQFVRAWPGGLGSYKAASNYAPTVYVSNYAAQKGCQQVLWLFGNDHQLTEVGTMNLFTFWVNEQGEKELITAPLNGLILPGITRKSLLELARKWGEFKVTERNYTMAEVQKALNEKRLLEMFGSGTACVVCPVEKILYNEEWLKIPAVEEKNLTKRFLEELTNIQYGKVPHEWTETLDY